MIAELFQGPNPAENIVFMVCATLVLITYLVKR